VSEAKVYRRLPAGGVIGPSPYRERVDRCATRNSRRRRGGFGSGPSMASCRSRSARSNAIQYCVHQPVVERPQSAESSALSELVARNSVLVRGLGLVFDEFALIAQPLSLGRLGVAPVVLVRAPPERNRARRDGDAHLRPGGGAGEPAAPLGPGSVPQHEKRGRVPPR
jgi:hypothetical protein